MNPDQILNLSYISAAILFIFGIKMLGSASTARKGNLISSVGMLTAIIVTLISQGLDYKWVAAGIITGTLIGVFAASRVKMTGMPELVALLNGFGGGASFLVGWAEYARNTLSTGYFSATVIFLAIFIGAVTFSGSLIAWGKLSGKLNGMPTSFKGQRVLNFIFFVSTICIGAAFILQNTLVFESILLHTLMILSIILGVMLVIPIGGGDMPVIISLLNSLSGLAACAAGFVLSNLVLIVAGSLVGASGLILTIIMCKAMNRSLINVLLGGFGRSITSGNEIVGEVNPISETDAYYILEAASKVLIIPGYGMAVAQAQHVIRELSDLLENNGCDIAYAIHPVAGRMPGHMNVLLAEADVPYEQLLEMDTANAQLPITDVAIVIGANDVVNPAASKDSGSPIYGMPIINAHHSKTVFCLKRGQGTGFSGLQNQLFTMSNTRMIYGDAKSTISSLVNEFKNTK